MRAWAGCARVVDLLDADLDAGAILLAGIVPGTPLRGRELPLAEVGELLVELASVPAPVGVFPTLAERVNLIFDLARRSRHIPRDRLASSRKAALALAADGPRMLLHGDLHPGNVLDGAAGIVAIDPRPCVGDPAFDAVDWAIRSDPAIFPALPAGRVRAWCEALAVLFEFSSTPRS
ncbi:MAG TPA: phosphotransferase [Amycolatopsis sp.]|uniref:phosphotransferase n=1 Tax=Amycolatopsis sp. TaxID=37632 RepID=UPI002B4A8A41|nr:phosphotransferase [Amycolatopsis sp.]HKS44956.1 phosphotransferase [Amycolatopsis sp.]